MDSADHRGQAPFKSVKCSAAQLDAQHFAAILDRYSARIHAYISNRVRNRETANELTQEALSKAWEGRSTFNSGRDELPWLIAIAGNVVTDHIKKVSAKKRQPEAGQLLPRSDGRFATGVKVDAAVRSELPPIDKMIDAERVMALDAAIERLDRRKRDVITLRRAGLSYDEIARRTRLRPGSVGSIITRATEELRIMLAEHVD